MIHLVIQARLSSTRMPVKILAPWGDHPTLLQHIMAVCLEVHADSFTLATDHPSSYILRQYAYKPYRFAVGSTHDVLKRILGATTPDDTWIFRVCADSPFLSSALMNHLIMSIDEDHDLLFMDTLEGLSGELIRRQALVDLDASSPSAYNREYVITGLSPLYTLPIMPPKLSIDTEAEYVYLRSLL